MSPKIQPKIHHVFHQCQVRILGPIRGAPIGRRKGASRSPPGPPTWDMSDFGQRFNTQPDLDGKNWSDWEKHPIKQWEKPSHFWCQDHPIKPWENHGEIHHFWWWSAALKGQATHPDPLLEAAAAIQKGVPWHELNSMNMGYIRIYIYI